jgi:hypothetical protein
MFQSGLHPTLFYGHLLKERLRLKSPWVNRGDVGNYYLRDLSGGAKKIGYAG